MKTQVDDNLNPAEVLASLASTAQLADAQRLLVVFEEVLGLSAKVWAGKIMGFGQYHYRYASGHSGTWFCVGFAPRKQDITLYFPALLEEHAEVLARLGKYKMGKSCLYLKRLADVEEAVLRELIAVSYAAILKQYPNE
jgi:hypothetical protein